MRPSSLESSCSAPSRDNIRGKELDEDRLSNFSLISEWKEGIISRDLESVLSLELKMLDRWAWKIEIWKILHKMRKFFLSFLTNNRNNLNTIFGRWQINSTISGLRQTDDAHGHAHEIVAWSFRCKMSYQKLFYPKKFRRKPKTAPQLLESLWPKRRIRERHRLLFFMIIRKSLSLYKRLARKWI